MKQYIHDENVALFKRKLADPNTKDGERETVLKLLAQEEKKELPSLSQPQSRR